MPTPAETYNKTFAAARLLRELARDVHGNLAALGVAPLVEATAGDGLQSLGDELNAIALRLVELRERSAAIAEAHVARHASTLRANFGYRLASRDGVRQITTPPEDVSVMP